MQAKSITGGLLLAGLLLVGCGGPEMVEEPQAQLDSREDALPYCGNQTYLIDYYSDATYTKLVGSMSCSCYETAWISGRRTSFAVTDYIFTCE